MTDLKKDEIKTIKTFRHGTHDPKTDFTVPHSPRPNFNPDKSDSVVDPYGHLQMKVCVCVSARARAYSCVWVFVCTRVYTFACNLLGMSTFF
jgi:hypothetical protein